MYYIVIVDDENNAEDWWDAARKAGLTPVPACVDQAWLERAQSLPGWDGGPEYAPHPLIIEEKEYVDD